MALETIAMASASPSRAAWKTVRQVASWGCSRKSRVSTESQPRCTAARASASIARAENTVSRQPRLPQEQMDPYGFTVRWPMLPATPECPRSTCPLTRAAPPTPLPRVSMSTFSRPRAAPIVIGEHRHLERQADEIHDAQSLEEMQRAAQAFDAGGVGVDQAFTAHTRSGGKLRALHTQPDDVLQGRQ